MLQKGDVRAGRTVTRTVNLENSDEKPITFRGRVIDVSPVARHLVDPARADPSGYDCGAGERHWCALKARGLCSCAPIPGSTRALTDEDRRILNGLETIDPETYSLWKGDWHDRYHSQSEADFGLLSRLRRYRCDRDQLIRLFRASGLYREKTDSRRGHGTYLTFSVDRLLASEVTS